MFLCTYSYKKHMQWAKIPKYLSNANASSKVPGKFSSFAPWNPDIKAPNIKGVYQRMGLKFCLERVIWGAVNNWTEINRTEFGFCNQCNMCVVYGWGREGGQN